MQCAGPRPGGRYLTAQKVASLDLSRFGLVVLSACETGLGHRAAGEGVIGLRRAFQTARAWSVISSLWSVPDESTRELVQSFYENPLLRGWRRAERLARPSSAMLNKTLIEHGDPLPSTWALRPERGLEVSGRRAYG